MSSTPVPLAADASGTAEADGGAGVVANSAWLLLAQGVSAGVGGIVTIYAIRHFTTSEWGHYSTALALVTLFTVFSGPGLGTLVLRDLTAHPDWQDDVLRSAMSALALSFGGAAAALVLATVALGYDREVVEAAVILAPLLLLDPLLANISSAFNARSRLVYVAVIQIVRTGVYGGLAVLLIAASASVTGLAAAALAGAVCAAAVGIALLRSRLGARLSGRVSVATAWRFLRAALPFAAVGVVGIVYERIDTLMLSVLSNADAVAHYTAPYSFVRLSWILPSVVSAAFFPLLSRRLRTDPGEAEQLYFRVVRIFVLLSVVLALLLAVAAPLLLPLVFGEKYRVAVPVLEVLAWTAVCTFGNYIFWYGIIVAREERAALAVQLAGLAVNVAANAVAIPLWGPTGAAAALVLSELFVVIGQARIVHRRLFPVPVAALVAKPLLAAALAVPVAVLLARESAAAGAVAGAAVYAGVLLLLRYVTPDEWRPLTAMALRVVSKRPG